MTMCCTLCAGLRVSNATFNALVMRYSDKEGHIAFDDFVAAYIKLKSLFGWSMLSLYCWLLWPFDADCWCHMGSYRASCARPG